MHADGQVKTVSFGCMDVQDVALPAVLGAETEPAAFDLLGVSSLLNGRLQLHAFYEF